MSFNDPASLKVRAQIMKAKVWLSQVNEDRAVNYNFSIKTLLRIYRRCMASKQIAA